MKKVGRRSDQRVQVFAGFAVNKAILKNVARIIWLIKNIHAISRAES